MDLVRAHHPLQVLGARRDAIVTESATRGPSGQQAVPVSPAGRGRKDQRSTISAMPSPPPMQSDATPRLKSWSFMVCSSVTSTRAPEAPIG